MFFHRTLSEACSGHLDIVTVLLAAGADASAKEEDGKTALMRAVKKKENLM